VQIGKDAWSNVKKMLNTLENVYPDNHLHVLFLNADFDPVYVFFLQNWHHVSFNSPMCCFIRFPRILTSCLRVSSGFTGTKSPR